MKQQSGIFERFDKVRKLRGLTYQDIEDSVGIPKQTLFGLKRRDSLNIKTLTALSQVLKISVDQLLGLSPLLTEQPAEKTGTQPAIIKVPSWRLANFNQIDKAKYRFMSEEIGNKTFGIAVDQSETNFPKGTILYFNPEIMPKNDNIVLLKKGLNDYRIRKIIIENQDVYFSHLKLNLTEKIENAEVIGTCTLVVTDLYYASFD